MLFLNYNKSRLTIKKLELGDAFLSETSKKNESDDDMRKQNQRLKRDELVATQESDRRDSIIHKLKLFKTLGHPNSYYVN